MKLYEGNGTVEHSDARAGFSWVAGCLNVGLGGATAPAFRSVIQVGGEEWLLSDYERARSNLLDRKNLSRGVADARDEAHVLGHADVIAAIDEALPGLEAWERTL